MRARTADLLGRYPLRWLPTHERADLVAIVAGAGVDHGWRDFYGRAVVLVEYLREDLRDALGCRFVSVDDLRATARGR